MVIGGGGVADQDGIDLWDRGHSQLRGQLVVVSEEFSPTGNQAPSATGCRTEDTEQGSLGNGDPDTEQGHWDTENWDGGMGHWVQAHGAWDSVSCSPACLTSGHPLLLQMGLPWPQGSPTSASWAHSWPVDP